MRIGICDDFPELRMLLRSEIESGSYVEDYEIDEFDSALEIVEKQPQLDVLFLDVDMPGMTGPELLRKHPDLFRDTKVVIVTSYTNFRAEGCESMVYRYLTKPAGEEQLTELFASF